MTTPIVVSGLVGLVPSGGGGVAVAVLNASLDVLKYAAISAAPPPSPIAPAQCAMVRAAANAVVLFDKFLSFLVSRRFLSETECWKNQVQMPGEEHESPEKVRC